MGAFVFRRFPYRYIDCICATVFCCTHAAVCINIAFPIGGVVCNGTVVRVSYPPTVVVILFETSIVTVYRYLIMGQLQTDRHKPTKNSAYRMGTKELHDKDERERREDVILGTRTLAMSHAKRSQEIKP